VAPPDELRGKGGTVYLQCKKLCGRRWALQKWINSLEALYKWHTFFINYTCHTSAVIDCSLLLVSTWAPNGAMHDVKSHYCKPLMVYVVNYVTVSQSLLNWLRTYVTVIYLLIVCANINFLAYLLTYTMHMVLCEYTWYNVIKTQNIIDYIHWQKMFHIFVGFDQYFIFKT